jgi:hypothetical protein
MGERLNWFFMLVIFMWCSAAQAQTATDVELQAAYCLAVSTAQLQEEIDAVGAAKDSSSKTLHKQVEKLVAERQRRFRDYLEAKGFMDARNPEAIKVPILRGRDDVDTCKSDLEKDFFKSCSEKCAAKHAYTGESAKQCNAKCPSPEACTRVKKCLANFLPF